VHGGRAPSGGIYRKIRKRWGRAKILASVMVEISEDEKGARIGKYPVRPGQAQ